MPKRCGCNGLSSGKRFPPNGRPGERFIFRRPAPAKRCGGFVLGPDRRRPGKRFASHDVPSQIKTAGGAIPERSAPSESSSGRKYFLPSRSKERSASLALQSGPGPFFFSPINREALRPAAINRAGGEGKRFDNDQRPAKRSFRTKRFGSFGLFNERSAYLQKAPGENAAAQKEMLRPRKTTTGPWPVFYFSGERFIQRSNVPERSASVVFIPARLELATAKISGLNVLSERSASL